MRDDWGRVRILTQFTINYYSYYDQRWHGLAFIKQTSTAYCLQSYTITSFFCTVGGSNGVNTRPAPLLAASLTTATSFKSQILSLYKPGHWIRIYSKQKDIEYISASNIRVAFDIRPPQ